MSRLTRRAMLRAKQELRRGKRLENRTPTRKRNPKRAAKRRQEHFGDEADYIASLPCDTCHKPGPSDPHHEPPRSTGGTKKDLVPLCKSNPATGHEGHHDERHRIGRKAFEAKYNVDLKARARMYNGWFHEDPQPLGF